MHVLSQECALGCHHVHKCLYTQAPLQMCAQCSSHTHTHTHTLHISSVLVWAFTCLQPCYCCSCCCAGDSENVSLFQSMEVCQKLSLTSGREWVWPLGTDQCYRYTASGRPSQLFRWGVPPLSTLQLLVNWSTSMTMLRSRTVGEWLASYLQEHFIDSSKLVDKLVTFITSGDLCCVLCDGSIDCNHELLVLSENNIWNTQF